MNNVDKMQIKLNNKYPLESIKVLEANGAKGKLVYKCLSCEEQYAFSHGENAYTRKKYLCNRCGKKIERFNAFQKKLLEQYPKDILEVQNFTHRLSPCTIQCKTCGKTMEYKQAVNALKHIRPYFCSYCFPQKQEILLNLKNSFLIWLSNNPQWILITDINNCHIQSQDLVECKCQKCGKSTLRTMYDFMRSRVCSCENPATPITQEEFENNLGLDYELLSSYKGIYQKVLIRHKACGFIHKTIARNVWISGGACPKCSKKRSKGEKKIKEFLEDKKIPFIQEYPLLVNNRRLLVDFYLPEQDFYIEFNGVQHYKPIDYFGGEKRFVQQKEYDILKQQTLQDKLFIISYLDIDNISTLLEQKLQSSTTKW